MRHNRRGVVVNTFLPECRCQRTVCRFYFGNEMIVMSINGLLSDQLSILDQSLVIHLFPTAIARRFSGRYYSMLSSRRHYWLALSVWLKTRDCALSTSVYPLTFSFLFFLLLHVITFFFSLLHLFFHHIRLLIIPLSFTFTTLLVTFFLSFSFSSTFINFLFFFSC